MRSGHCQKEVGKLRHHAIPQTHPFNCLKYADFIGRFESLSADFRKVCDKIGAEGTLPHMNVTQHDGYKQYYDDETRQIVELLYEGDIREFGYTF